MPTSRGRATRERIVDAAWELSDRRGVEGLLGGVTLREVARASGLTPSAITYHFPTMREVALAMVDRHVELATATEALAAVEAHLAGLADRSGDGDVASVVRAAAAANWSVLTSEPEVRNERRQARCFAAGGDEVDGAYVAARLDQLSATWAVTLSELYRRAGRRVGLATVAPLEYEDLAVIGMALADGLVRCWATEPGRVRDDLLPHAFVALTSALLVADPQRVTLDEVGTRLSAVGSGDGAELSVSEAERVARLLADGPEGLSLSDVATELDVEVAELAHRFGSLRRLAALSFGRHCGAVTAAVERRSAAGPAIGLTDGVVELARLTQAEPHAACALAQERLECALAGPGHIGFDVVRAAPIARALCGPLEELTGEGREGPGAMAELLVDTVLGQGLANPRSAPAAVAEVALRLVPADF